MSPIRVAIIGGGISGLCMLDACVDEGLVPTLFEEQKTLGGVWSKDVKVAYDSVRLNTSKYTYGFSKFPWPDDTPLYPSRDEVGAYIENFVKAFGYEKYIKRGVRASVSKADGGKWTVQGEVFDKIAVCCGVHNTPARPAGLTKALSGFDGKLLWAGEYQSPQQDGGLFKGKRVAVIGSNFSGPETAVELAEAGGASSVTLVQRSPVWHIARRSESCGVPFDMHLNRRCTKEPFDTLQVVVALRKPPSGPLSVEGHSPESLRIGIAPDSFWGLVESGKVEVKRAGVEGSGAGGKVQFSDGSTGEFDVVVCQAGFVANFKFLPDDCRKLLRCDESSTVLFCALHKHTWPLESNDHMDNMAFIGIANLYSSYFYMVEMQSRWAAAVFSGRVAKDNEKEYDESRKALAARLERPWVGQFTAEALPVPELPGFMDCLARKLGCYPEEIVKEESHPLHEAVKYGPITNASLRLVGPTGTVPEVAAKQLVTLQKQFKEWNVDITDHIGTVKS